MFFVDFRVVLPVAVRAHSVAEFRLAPFLDVFFHLGPVSLAAPDFLAVHANRQYSFQPMDFLESGLQRQVRRLQKTYCPATLYFEGCNQQ